MVRAVFWFRRNMLEAESSKTLILCHLSDMPRIGISFRALVVLWIWFIFCSLGAGASRLISTLPCGNLFGFVSAPAQFGLMKPPQTNRFFLSPNIFENIKSLDDGWGVPRVGFLVKGKILSCLYIRQPIMSGLYSVPRDSQIPGVVRLMISALQLGCVFCSDRLIHTYRYLREVYRTYRLIPPARAEVSS